VRNARAFYHSVEQRCLAAIISELKPCKVHKRPMDVIRRHRRRDTIDVGQVTLLVPLLSEEEPRFLGDRPSTERI
jgi:hypothetical protein